LINILFNLANIQHFYLIFFAYNNRAETNIKPWENTLKDIKEGNKKTNWKDRVPYAYWKGNPYVAPARQNLLQCNVTLENDWNTLLYIQVFFFPSIWQKFSLKFSS
jgi:hypothetical protein